MEVRSLKPSSWLRFSVSRALVPPLRRSPAKHADEKKLAGAALKSFTTKCERDAKAARDASAKEKKLAGAAKRDAAGT